MAKGFKYPHCENIVIKEVNVAYRKEVVHYLDLVRTTYSGRRLFEFILRKKPLFIVIMPVTPAEHSVNNAYATATSDVDAYAKGKLVMTNLDLNDGEGSIMIPDMSQGLRTGTGNGSSSVVEYHPATWRQRMANRHKIDPGAGPGELLFHELVHAMRELNGVFVRNTVGANLKMDDFEEFCAILASNIYRQERGFKPLREDHHGFHSVPVPKSFSTTDYGRDGKRRVFTVTIEVDPNLSDPAEYYKFYKAQIQQWFSNQQDFCVALARAAVTHNPLAIAADDLGVSVLNG